MVMRVGEPRMGTPRIAFARNCRCRPHGALGQESPFCDARGMPRSRACTTGRRVASARRAGGRAASVACRETVAPLRGSCARAGAPRCAPPRISASDVDASAASRAVVAPAAPPAAASMSHAVHCIGSTVHRSAAGTRARPAARAPGSPALAMRNQPSALVVGRAAGAVAQRNGRVALRLDVPCRAARSSSTMPRRGSRGTPVPVRCFCARAQSSMPPRGCASCRCWRPRSHVRRKRRAPHPHAMLQAGKPRVACVLLSFVLSTATVGRRLPN
jgi:hypothetical protein